MYTYEPYSETTGQQKKKKKTVTKNKNTKKKPIIRLKQTYHL